MTILFMYIMNILLILGTLFFPQHFITEIFKNKEKLTELFEHPYSYNLDSIHFAVFVSHLSISYHPILFVDAFQNKLTNSFPKWFHQLKILSAMYENSVCSTSILTLGITSLFYFRHFDKCVEIFHCGFNLHFPHEECIPMCVLVSGLL